MTPAATDRSDEVASSIQGANPFIGLTPGQVVRAAARWAGGLARRPSVVVAQVLD